MNDQTMIRDLTSGHHLRQLISFSVPFMLSNLLQQVYTLTDMIIVGRFVGSSGLAAASNAGEIVFMCLFICIGFTSSGQIIISQHIGAGNRDKLSAAIGTLFSFTILLGAVLTIFPIIFCTGMLRLINIPEEAFIQAKNYALVCFCGNIPVFCYNAISSVLRGMGDSKHPMIFVIAASAINIGLDLLFVGPFGWECFGAALATVISQVIAFIAALVFVYRRRAAFGFDFRLKSFALDREQLGALVKLGVPLAIQSCSVSISMLFVNSCINAYGVVAAAVTAVGNKITILATIVTAALNTAGASIIAQSFAAGKLRRVSQTLLDILFIGLAFVVLLAALVALFPEQIFGLFDTSPEVIAMSHSFVPIAVISLIGFATRSAAFAFINGISFSSMAFAGGIIDGFVARVGLALLFGYGMEMGVFGFWLGSAVAGHVFSVIGGAYYLSGKWKNRKPIVAA